MAGLEQKIPITPNSVFDVVSIAKQFTGLAIAILESEKKLTFNAPNTFFHPEKNLKVTGLRVTQGRNYNIVLIKQSIPQEPK